jgi:glucose-6-phosphate isomerase
MLYQHDVEGCLRERVGEHGLDAAAFERYLERAAAALPGLRAARADGSLPVLALPERGDDIEALRPVAERLRGFGRLFLLGTGGSSLGARTLAALDNGHGTRIAFCDNIDPHGFGRLLQEADPEDTAVLAISKSGSTAETMTQLLITLGWLRDARGEAALARQVVLVTEPKDSVMTRIGRRFGLTVLDHDPRIGGRFSVLSLVGLLPAMVQGLDAVAVRAGAADVLARTLDDEGIGEPARGAALAVALERERQVRVSVLMPYVDRLADLGLWYRQLWAESLGKGGHGTLPANALGAVDQHSQLQLYLDGPADKMFSLIMLEVRGRGPRVPTGLADDPELAYLRGRTIGDLMDAEQRATYEALLERGRPTRVFRLDALDEATMGALLMHFMLETMIAADLLAVDAFDQPAVERGKVLAREYLAAMG